VNLINNALKYTMNGHIKLKITRTRTNSARFEVSDTGIGIMRPRLESIFNLFGKEENQTLDFSLKNVKCRLIMIKF
jgi:signal transduction histidine kinase